MILYILDNNEPKHTFKGKQMLNDARKKNHIKNN